MTVFLLLCCTLVPVIGASGSSARADKGLGDGGLDQEAEEDIPDSKVDVFLKTLEGTLEEVLEDLKVIDEEEEKNNIESGNK